MEEKLRKTGIDIIGDVPWGMHFCQFYQSKEDLIDILVPYFKAGLENNEFCMWVTSEPLKVEDARRSLKKVVKNLDDHIKKGQIEILDASQWHTKWGKFEANKVLQGWVEKENQAMKRGFDGLRLTGNTFWLEKKDWKEFADYEATVDRVIGKYRMIAICTYSLDKCGASEIIDVVSNHQFALIRRKDKWEIIQSAQRKRAEEVLKESESRYKQLFEGVGDLVIVYGSQGRFLHCNEVALKRLGYSREEFLKLKPADIVHPDFHRLMKDNQKKTWSGETTIVELALCCKDGTVIPVEVNACRIEYEGEPAILAVLRDITERKKAKKELSKLSSIADAMVDGVTITDLHGRISYINRAVTEQLGYEKEELIGKTPTEFIAEKDLPKFAAQVKKVLLNKQTSKSSEYLAKHKDGTEIPMSVTFSVLNHLEGEPKEIIAVSRDITEPKKAEEALRESEERYRALFEQAADSIVLVDAKTGELMEFNDKAHENLGYTREEFQKFRISGVETIESAEEIAKHINKIINEGADTFETKHRTKGGEIRNILVSAKAISIGGRDFIQGIWRDVTERKKTEQALREASTIINRSPAVAFTWRNSEGWPVEFVSENVVNLFGYTSEEFTSGKVSYAECVHPDDLERVALEVQTFSKKEDRTEFVHEPYRIIAKDGTEKLISDWTFITRDKEENITHYKGIVQDITERKRAEEALRASESEKKSILNAISDIVLFQDRSLFVQWANETAARSVGKTAQELVGCHCYEVWHGRSEPCDGCPILRALETGSRTEGSMTTPDGRWWEIIAEPVRDNAGKIVGAIEIARDITERKKMEEELLKIQKLESLGILAGGIAHDFNNVLTAILGNITLAKMSVNPEEEIFEILTEAEKASLRTKSLTQQLLTFSKGGAPVKKTVCIAGLLKNSVGFALRGSNVRCEFTTPDDLWPVEVDEGQMGQVINNLTINADQAMPEGGTIKVCAENMTVNTTHTLPIKKGKYVNISIQDQGTGIRQEHIQKIFDPYFTTKQKGSGLGLAIVYSIIKNHNGYVTVESELGVGTTFCIYLPASKKKILTKKDVEKRLIVGNGKILVMDDEEIVRDVAGSILERTGYGVEFAEDGAEAIKLYKKAKESGEPFDAVIIDLTVPGGMGGKKVVEKLLEIDPEVKAIVSSGYSDDPIMANFKKYGFSGVITKPYGIEELSEVLHKVITRTSELPSPRS